MRHLILGTAGHVDHGKTELVKALTGLDTDRLKEEKERGISIELGFAPLPLDNNVFLGVVDVPGHERFVKHMVAGAGGIDLVLLLVAADEGVMPQTREHMAVLVSLSIEKGLVVISKKDLAGEDVIEIVRDEISELTRGTFLEGAPVVETSARTGEGLEELKAKLVELAAGVTVRNASGPFRQPVDRVFHKKGIGVVVTGSCYSGTVRAGDALELLPSGRPARVREVQSFGDKRTEGFAGERLAVALQGVKLDEVTRGDMLGTPGAFRATRLMDARVELASYFDFDIKNRERLRIHHGAREALGRIILLETDKVRPGESTLAQLKLETPLVPAEGDHFVLRKYSPARVVGGGVVIETNPGHHKRSDKSVVDLLHLKEKGHPTEILCQSIKQAGLQGLPRAGAEPRILQSLLTDDRVTAVDNYVFCRETLETLARQVENLAGEYLDRHPLQWGMDKEELRQKCRFPHATPLFNGVLKVLGVMGPIFVRGNKVRAGSDAIELDEKTRNDLDGLTAIIKEAGCGFLSKTEVEALWKNPRHQFADAVQYLKEEGEVKEIGAGGLIHRESIDKCLETLRGLFEKRAELSVTDFKAALGLTRKHTIPILEAFDEEGITSRAGSVRVKGRNFPG